MSDTPKTVTTAKKSKAVKYNQTIKDKHKMQISVIFNLGLPKGSFFGNSAN